MLGGWTTDDENTKEIIKRNLKNNNKTTITTKQEKQITPLSPPQPQSKAKTETKKSSNLKQPRSIQIDTEERCSYVHHKRKKQ